MDSYEEIAHSLLNTHFGNAGEQTILLNDITEANLEETITITNKEIQAAITMQPENRAPGIDKIDQRILKNLLIISII